MTARWNWSIVLRDTYSGLPDKINATQADLAISLHCNAFNRRATGTEVLFYHTSVKGRMMAEILQSKLLSALELPDRGIKLKTSEDRGGYILRYTSMPCALTEAFFIDNDSDLLTAQSRLTLLRDAYCESIDRIAANLHRG